MSTSQAIANLNSEDNVVLYPTQKAETFFDKQLAAQRGIRAHAGDLLEKLANEYQAAVLTTERKFSDQITELQVQIAKLTSTLDEMSHNQKELSKQRHEALAKLTSTYEADKKRYTTMRAAADAAVNTMEKLEA